jgi:hypothetical protein
MTGRRRCKLNREIAVAPSVGVDIQCAGSRNGKNSGLDASTPEVLRVELAPPAIAQPNGGNRMEAAECRQLQNDFLNLEP